MAGGAQRGVTRVVLHLIGADLALALAHEHVPLERRLAIGAEACPVAAQVDAAPPEGAGARGAPADAATPPLAAASVPGCPLRVGQGGSSAQAAAARTPPSETTITNRNGLEPRMKGGIIMAPPGSSAPETPLLSHA